MSLPLINRPSVVYRTTRLVDALVRRGIQDQGWLTIVSPIAFAGFILFYGYLAIYHPELITVTSRRALSVGSHQYPGMTIAPAYILTLLLNQAPFLLAFIGSLAGASAAQALIGDETERGGIELLMTAPYRLRQLLVALLSSAFVLTMVNWALLSLTMLVFGSYLLHLVGLLTPHYVGRIGTALLVPLPLTFLSNLIAFAICIVYPKLGKIRAGTTNLVRLLAGMPALLAVAISNLIPSIDAVTLSFCIGILAVALAAVTIAVITRMFRPEILLGT